MFFPDARTISLFWKINSLFLFLGNLTVITWIHYENFDGWGERLVKWCKFPCKFPYIRELRARDWFSKDCSAHHSFPAKWPVLGADILSPLFNSLAEVRLLFRGLLVSGDGIWPVSGNSHCWRLSSSSNVNTWTTSLNRTIGASYVRFAQWWDSNRSTQPRAHPPVLK